MNNMDLWNAVADIDPAFTKPITGKDYRGTSPNPHYLIKLATEKLGPLGHGFGWEVKAEGFETMGDTTLHWCRIRFWWSRGMATRGEDGAIHAQPPGSFEAYGQTKAAYMAGRGENKYHRVDEDAPKKSLTDAVTKALASIGFGANIFLGRWDDSKYVDNVAAEFRAKDAEANEAKAAEQHAKFEREVANKMRMVEDMMKAPDTAAAGQEFKAFWAGLVADSPDVAREVKSRGAFAAAVDHFRPKQEDAA